MGYLDNTGLSRVWNRIKLQKESIAGTTQTVTYDANGNISSIVHKKNTVTIRTDTFTYGINTITEVRTLNNGESLTIVTDLSTLTAAVTYSST